MILKITDLCFSYKNNLIFDHIELDIHRGEIIGLVGDNGSGKSTLMKLIVKLLKPNQGLVELFSESSGSFIENPKLYKNKKVSQNIDFFGTIYGADDKTIIENSRITGVDKFLKMKVNKLSLGMKQRVGLTICLNSSSEFILLDEPTNGLDPTGKKEFLSLIKMLSEEKKMTIIISSHSLSDLEEVCDVFYKIENKKILNLHDKDNIYGYELIFLNDFAEVTKKLDEYECDYKFIDDKIVIKKASLSNKVIKYFELNGINITKRRIKDVYFE